MAEPWKVLVYIAADNSLYDDAQVSLRAIAHASRSSEIETIVQFDGPSAQLSTRYRCSGGSREVIWEAPDNYTLDRGQRLTDFLMASVDHPQERKRIFLVLWGHGAGLDHIYFFANPDGDSSGDGGAGPDSGAGAAGAGSSAGAGAGTTPPAGAPSAAAPAFAGGAVNSGGAAGSGSGAAKGGAIFAPMEVFNGANPNRYVGDISLAKILEEFSRSMNRKIDLLGFDSCMMAMVEIWHELRESTELAVASDLEVPANSWPYTTILSDLASYPGMDASTLATVIVSRYLEDYDGQGQGVTVSLSACSLAACNAFAEAMKKLVDEMKKVVGDGESRRKVFRARDASWTPEEATYIDMGHFAQELSESFSSTSGIYEGCIGVLRILTGFPYLLYNREGGTEESFYKGTGVALYFPTSVAPTIEEVQDFAAQNNLEVGTKFHPEADTEFPPTMGKFPPTMGKFAPTMGKFPPTMGKFPPTMGKFPPTMGKFPPTMGKFPPTMGKFPPTMGKFPPTMGKGGDPTGGGADDAISGYEILWDRYIELDFCKTTGWADLIESLLNAGY